VRNGYRSWTSSLVNVVVVLVVSCIALNWAAHLLLDVWPVLVIAVGAGFLIVGCIAVLRIVMERRRYW